MWDTRSNQLLVIDHAVHFFGEIWLLLVQWAGDGQKMPRVLVWHKKKHLSERQPQHHAAIIYETARGPLVMPILQLGPYSTAWLTVRDPLGHPPIERVSLLLLGLDSAHKLQAAHCLAQPALTAAFTTPAGLQRRQALRELSAVGRRAPALSAWL